MKSLVLDTHAFLWLLEGNTKLPASLRQFIEDETSDLYLPVLIVAEMVDLISKGRSRLDLADLHTALKADARLVTVSMTPEIALSTANYTSLPDIHDRCIVATTAKLIETVPNTVLVTRDKAIRDSKLVPTLWE